MRALPSSEYFKLIYLNMNTPKLLLLLLSLIALFLAGPVSDLFAIRTGEPLPEVVLPSLDGGYISLSNLEGRVIVLNFWAAWCAPCSKEIGALNGLARVYKNDIAVIGITNDDPRTIRDFIRLQPIAYPVLLDSQSNIHKRFEVLEIPATFIVDRGGVLRKKYSGPVDIGELGAVIESLL